MSLDRRVWSQDEDQLLKRLIRQHGTKAWTLIAQEINKNLLDTNRTGKQCRQRWLNHLDERIVTSSDWFQEDLQLMLKLRLQFGNKWTKISELMPGRSQNSIKNFFYSNLKKGRTRLNKTPQLKLRPLKMQFFTKDQEPQKKLIVDNTVLIGFFKNSSEQNQLLHETLLLIENFKKAKNSKEKEKVQLPISERTQTAQLSTLFSPPPVLTPQNSFASSPGQFWHQISSVGMMSEQQMMSGIISPYSTRSSIKSLGIISPVLGNQILYDPGLFGYYLALHKKRFT